MPALQREPPTRSLKRHRNQLLSYLAPLIEAAGLNNAAAAASTLDQPRLVVLQRGSSLSYFEAMIGEQLVTDKPVEFEK